MVRAPILSIVVRSTIDVGRVVRFNGSACRSLVSTRPISGNGDAVGDGNGAGTCARTPIGVRTARVGNAQRARTGKRINSTFTRGGYDMRSQEYPDFADLRDAVHLPNSRSVVYDDSPLTVARPCWIYTSFLPRTRLRSLSRCVNIPLPMLRSICKREF